MDSSLHFDNVQGEYTLMESGMNVPREVIYAADMVGLKGMEYRKNDGREFTSFSYGDAKKIVIIDEMEKTYSSIKWLEENEEDIESYSTLDRLYKGLRRGPMTSNILTVDVINSFFVQSLRHYADWEFEEITFLDMPSYRIQGIDGVYTDGAKFEMVVEKNTGIILDYHLFDKNNEEMITLITKSIQIDEGIDATVFEWDSTGYEEE